MFCNKCGSDLPAKASFCGICGAECRPQNNQQTNAQIRSASGCPKVVTMIAFLIIISSVTILLWFNGMFTVEDFYDEEISFTWSNIYEDDPEIVLEILRWSGIILLAVNIWFCIRILAEEEYKEFHIGFNWSIVTSLANFIFHLILVIWAFKEIPDRIDINVTVWNVMFFVMCVLMFILSLSLSSATWYTSYAYNGTAAHMNQPHFATKYASFAKDSRSETLATLDEWLKAGLITDDEYEIKRRNLK